MGKSNIVNESTSGGKTTFVDNQTSEQKEFLKYGNNRDNIQIPLCFIGGIATDIVQNPRAKVVELSDMYVATRKAEELDIGVFNGKPYLYHDQIWHPLGDYFELEDSI